MYEEKMKSRKRKFALVLTLTIVLCVLLLTFLILQILECTNVINSNGLIGMIMGSVILVLGIVFAIFELTDSFSSKKKK